MFVQSKLLKEPLDPKPRDERQSWVPGGMEGRPWTESGGKEMRLGEPGSARRETPRGKGVGSAPLRAAGSSSNDSHYSHCTWTSKNPNFASRPAAPPGLVRFRSNLFCLRQSREHRRVRGWPQAWCGEARAGAAVHGSPPGSRVACWPVSQARSLALLHPDPQTSQLGEMRSLEIGVRKIKVPLQLYWMKANLTLGYSHVCYRGRTRRGPEEPPGGG